MCSRKELTAAREEAQRVMEDRQDLCRALLVAGGKLARQHGREERAAKKRSRGAA